MIPHRRPFPSDLHTHTVFGGGRHTPREMVATALDAGLQAIGFAEPVEIPGVPGSGMTAEEILRYREEISALQSAFSDRIRILCGLEQDLYAPLPQVRFDCVVGEMRYVRIRDAYCPLDGGEDALLDAVNRYFDGDVYRLIREYYRQMCTLKEKTQCDMVGRFDLITKYNTNGKLFDESDPRYLSAAIEALDVLLEKDVVFELYTGDFFSEHRRLPYPSPVLLRYIAQKGGQILPVSGTRRKEDLCFAFDDAIQLARACGFGSVLTLTHSGWKNRSI